MSEIKPINYEEILINHVNYVYQNFKDNVEKDFVIPEQIILFFKENPLIKTRKDIENLGISLDQTFDKWQQGDKSIIITHLLSILQNCLIVLFSIDRNLENESLGKNIINSKAGVDVVIATAVQAVGMKANELIKTYEILNLAREPHLVFNSINNHLIQISKLDAELAFSKLVENLLEFNQSYINSYKKLSTVGEDEYTKKRLELFIEYMNTYYLFVFLLELILIYPLQEELMTQKVFENILPNIELY